MMEVIMENILNKKENGWKSLNDDERQKVFDFSED